MAEKDKPVVVVGGKYKESDDHVPDPTAQFGTLDTSGTAGGAHSKIEEVSPIFEVARAQDLQIAAKAVDPNDTSVTEGEAVSLSTGTTVVSGDPDADRKRITEAAKAYEKDPVVVGGPTPAQEAAAEKGPDKAAKVEAEQKDAAAK